MHSHSIAQIRADLRARFMPLGEAFSAYYLVEKSWDDSAIKQQVLKQLAVTLPKDFQQFADDYDLADFSLGPFCFGYQKEKSYWSYLLAINTVDAFGGCWWDTVERPAEWLVIALSDPYAVLINCTTEAIYALDSELGLSKALMLAPDFMSFFQAAGCQYLYQVQAQAIAHYLNVPAQAWQVYSVVE
ncbi:hypothetical protein VQ643_09140 [Pseudomonas sp. F1_0610]|uniref:hypothetical protein n=1 Tax=Pseudomonas sp. F1_0610 TaxID=3114284 RepID=UPI0039C2DB41